MNTLTSHRSLRPFWSLTMILSLLVLSLLGLTSLTRAQGDKTEAAPIVATALPTVITAGSVPANTPIYVTPPASDSSLLLLYLPLLIVMGFLVTIIIILVWGRDELTKLLAGYVSPEMAGTLMDSGVKLALQAGYAVAAKIPGQTDDEALDVFARQAGYERTTNADGSHTLRRRETGQAPG